MEITTSKGFKCNINENRLKDWRYVKASAKMAKAAKADDEIELIDLLDYLITFLMGEENKNAFLESLAGDEGVCESHVVVEEFQKITNALSEQLKKSTSSPG